MSKQEEFSSANFNKKTIFTGDNLPIMRGMNSNCIDLICLDPAFNSKANYAAPIGSMAAGAEFKDTWALSDVDVAWLEMLGKNTEIWNETHLGCNLAPYSWEFRLIGP